MSAEDSQDAKQPISVQCHSGSPAVSHSDEAPDGEAQAGVQDIEATALAWEKSTLILAYVMLWIIYFNETMLSGTNLVLVPYVTSAFAEHSLTPTVTIISSIVGGVTNLTIAKILDVFGRAQGYLFCIVIAVTGLIMMAAGSNVETYAAAMVFYIVSNNGIQYTNSVFIADTTKLKNRGLMQAILNSSAIITTWLAGPISQGFLQKPGWRWCYGMFAILVPVVTLPLCVLLWLNLLKAKRLGLTTKHDSGRTMGQSIYYYCRQFDAIGLLLCSAGVALFLLPFNLYNIRGQGWDSALIISMLVAGPVLLIAFVVWERYFAPFTFMPYGLLLDRTVFGACLLAAVLFCTYSIWNSYFSSVFQVVNGLDVKHASYVIQSYTVVGLVVAVIAGYFLHATSRFKLITPCVGVSMSIFGQGVVVITDEIAILAAASHEYVAVCIAVLGIFSSVGGAVGSTIAAAIWTHMVPKKLAEYLPADQQENLLLIFASLPTQLSYPIGSPTRLAIQRAYGNTMKVLLSVSIGIWAVGIVGILAWRNIDVRGIRQTKGRVW